MGGYVQTFFKLYVHGMLKSFKITTCQILIVLSQELNVQHLFFVFYEQLFSFVHDFKVTGFCRSLTQSFVFGF